MKKILLFSFLIAGMLFFVSCGPDTREEVTTTTTYAEKVTYSDQGFLVEQQIVVAGNTVWGISEKTYGTETKWRDIVALNPFLGSTDRLYYNPDKKMWIVRIYPGEVLNIGGQKVYPSCTYEKTTTTTTIKHTPAPVIPWWGWVLITLSGLLILWALINSICWCWRRCCCNAHRICCENTSIDCATTAYFLGREKNQEDRIIDILDRGSRRNGRLTEFEFSRGNFFASAKFSERFRTEDKKPEPKQDVQQQ